MGKETRETQSRATLLRRIATFLRPTVIKLIFLVEWAAFIVLLLLRGDLPERQQRLVAAYPLVFFYLVACALDALHRRRSGLAAGWRLPALALGLAALDQTSKALIVRFAPHEESVPLIEGWLHLSHVRNEWGSWFAKAFDLRIGVLPLAIVVVLILLGSVACHRYYVATRRRSVWADIAFLGLFASCASWMCDMAVRVHIVDFIQLPGVVAADLKDILAAIGLAAFFAEGVDNPNVSLRWEGWRAEAKAARQLTGNVIAFTVGEMRQFWGQVQEKLGKKPPSL